MSASVLPWLGAAAVVWLLVVVLLWAMVRAAALADAREETVRGPQPAGEERTLSTPDDVVAAAVEWTDADEARLYAGGERRALRAVAGEGQARFGVAMLDAAGEAVEAAIAIDVWVRGADPPLLVLAQPVLHGQTVTGALVVAQQRPGPRIGFTARRALAALAQAAGALPAPAPKARIG